jgi:predicted methyltransferase
LLTSEVVTLLQAARDRGDRQLTCSLDLKRSESLVEIHPGSWICNGAPYSYPERCREATIYYWKDSAWEPVAHFGQGLIKLKPTDWGPPTFEIDGIKMLPTAQVSPYEDARRKTAMVSPEGKVVLDTCGGLGYFAHWCLEQGASRVLSFEKNPDVIWLRSLNPWSPGPDARLELAQGDIAQAIVDLPTDSVEAILHDPPRFGIAGELYSQTFYDELARVLKRGGKLFHYTGTPNKLTSGRDVPAEVTRRLEKAGFEVKREGDGLLATGRRWTRDREPRGR